MPFRIVRNDITRMQVDAIVNTTNPGPSVGSGVDAGVHHRAGPELLSARQAIGPIAVGDAALTPGFRLPARFVIHAVAPAWQGGAYGEEALLRRCYDRCLALAWEQGCQSVAFPLLAAGNLGFPRDRAMGIALSAIGDFLTERELEVYLAVFDRESYVLSETLVHSVSSYIDEHYVEQVSRLQQLEEARPRKQAERRRLTERLAGFRRGPRKEPPLPDETPVWSKPEERSMEMPAMEAPQAYMAPPAPAASLPDFLKQEDAGFTETLLKLIDRSGKKDSQVYKKANLSKQHFSKIRNNPDYRPTKPTAIALALALELDLEGMKDLIGRAGFALTNSSKFDLIIRYFVERGIYDVMQINLALYEFDQSLLGG